MLFDDQIKFYKTEAKNFTNKTCDGAGKYTDIVYDKKKAGLFWVKDSEGNFISFLDNPKSKCIQQSTVLLDNIDKIGINDLYYVMTDDSLYIGETMDTLRAFPHLYGSLTVISDSLFAVNSTLYKNMFTQSKPAPESSSFSTFNTVLIVIGVLIVLAFIYLVYSTKSKNTETANQRVKGTYERVKPDPR